VARGAIAASGSGRAGGTRMTGRPGRPWMNGDSNDIIEAQMNVLVNRGARLDRGPGGPGAAGRVHRDNLPRHPFSWELVTSCALMFVGFRRFRH